MNAHAQKQKNNIAMIGDIMTGHDLATTSLSKCMTIIDTAANNGVNIATHVTTRNTK